VTAIDTRVAAVTVTLAEPATPPKVAVIVADPVPIAVVSPKEPALSPTKATVELEELQLTEVVRFCVELSV